MMSRIEQHQRVGRMSRRAMIRMAGAGGLALAGCGPKARPSTNASGGSAKAGTPKRGGSLTLSDGNGGFQRGFDPHVLPLTQTGFMGMFYSNLMRAMPPAWKIVPDLAAKWEQPSPTELVFTLRPNIKWQNKPPASGRLLKAADVVYSYNRIRTDDPKFINKSLLANVDSIQAVDDQTIRFKLKQEDATTLSNMTAFSIEVLAPEVVEKAGKLATADAAVGTGPFILQQSEEKVGATFVRNPDYFKPGLPYLDRIDWKVFADDQAEWAAFVAGQTDERWVPGNNVADITGRGKDKYSSGWVGDLGMEIMMPNISRKPMDDPRVTRALRLLVDHEEFKSAWANQWYGRGRNSTAFAATAESWDLSENEYAQHLEWKPAKDDAVKEGLSLLSAAGFDKNKPLKFELASNTKQDVVAAVQLLQAQWKRLSQGAVDVSLKLYEPAAWDSTRANATFDYFAAGHDSGGSDPDSFFKTTYQTGGSRNYGKMSDAQLDQMIVKQRTILDDAERKKAVRDILLYMIDHAPYSVAIDRYVLCATQKAVQDYTPDGTSRVGYTYENIWVNR